MTQFGKLVTVSVALAMTCWAVAGSAGAVERRVRDRRENVRDRREDVRDRREDVRDRREDVRDRREDIRDRADGDNGPRDRAEDIRDRREDVRDRREDVRDRREDVRDRREDARDRLNDPRTPEEREAAREKVVDKRESNQAKRIEHGIKKGYLTAEEVKKLETQQTAIAAMEESFKGDGNLSAAEFRKLQRALGEASRSIWVEKHDVEGNQMSVYCLGRNVKLNAEVAGKLSGDELTKAEARALARDFHRLLSLRHRLAVEDLDEAARARLHAEYNELLNKYFQLVEETEAKE